MLKERDQTAELKPLTDHSQILVELHGAIAPQRGGDINGS